MTPAWARAFIWSYSKGLRMGLYKGTEKGFDHQYE
jgi:hypothetical protein